MTTRGNGTDAMIRLLRAAAMLWLALTLPAAAIAAGSGSVDTAPVDTAPVDTATVDTAPVDTAPVDTAPVDTAPVDTATVPRALASNGAIVVMPGIEQLDCDGLTQVLHRLDLSNYRGVDPVPADSPDRAIFDYEDRLARAYFRRCIMSADRLEDPAPAFSAGFGIAAE